MDYRRATIDDIETIAALHADSWRRTYRGAFSDDYLDHEVDADRLAVWTGRLRNPDVRHHTVVADEGGEIVGFVHTVFDEDQRWGALLDNLHVAAARKGQGIGTRLMGVSAKATIEHDPESGLYLWVLEANTAARAFYEARGGQRADTGLEPSPHGPDVVGIRYVWPDPSVLVDRG